MRVVVGYDGSPESDVAAALVATAFWPPETSIRFVHAVATRAASPPPDVLSSTASRVPLRSALEDAEATLESAAKWIDLMPNAEIELRYGRDVAVLASEAHIDQADLLVVGSRGRGPYASLFLGSVSADVVDAAQCPVLIARRQMIERVVVASDGSPSADGAVAVVATWPMFESADIKVVSVGDSMRGFGTLPVSAQPVESSSGSAAARSEPHHFDHVTVAAAAARRLRDADRHARATIRLGDPSKEIIALAESSRSDLIVLGTRGHKGVARVLMGSTAREVLLGTDASVLICR